MWGLILTLSCVCVLCVAEPVTQSALIAWYLEEIGDDIETEAELKEKQYIVKRVIDRLVTHVSNIFYQLSNV